jgi:hypothetical protein
MPGDAPKGHKGLTASGEADRRGPVPAAECRPARRSGSGTGGRAGGKRESSPGARAHATGASGRLRERGVASPQQKEGSPWRGLRAHHRHPRRVRRRPGPARRRDRRAGGPPRGRHRPAARPDPRVRRPWVGPGGRAARSRGKRPGSTRRRHAPAARTGSRHRQEACHPRDPCDTLGPPGGASRAPGKDAMRRPRATSLLMGAMVGLLAELLEKT